LAVRRIIMFAYVPQIRPSNKNTNSGFNKNTKWVLQIRKCLWVATDFYTKKTHHCTKQFLPTRFELLKEK
jgi:hypothetical protein